MTSRIGEIVIECTDPAAEAEFWCGALGYRVTARDETGVAIGGAGAAPTILVVRGAAPRRRLPWHLDLCPTDRDQAAEVDRLVGLGARPVDIGQGDVSWTVLADPAGYLFCVHRKRIPPEPAPFHD